MTSTKTRADGTFLFAWGERGTGDGQFTGAHSIAINNEGELFVCDEDRVQVFASDGAYLRSWTARGLPEDFHNSLGGVTVDPAGRVYVTIPPADRVRSH